MDDLKEVLETLSINREIAQKFFEIEIQILSIFNFRDLFESLLTEIQEKFGVPFVWISMIDKSDISNLIRDLEYSEILKERLNTIDRDIFLGLIQDNKKPMLINDHLEPFYALFPKNQQYRIGSLAIAPLTFRGAIIGSLNQADYSEMRYVSGMDTSLLEQLTVKVSISLSNVMAHEQLKLLAYSDPVTGVYNRHVMERQLQREFKLAKRYGKPLSVVFLDLDNFKAVNDRYGHDLGDALLRYVAKHLSKECRGSDVVARFAGDEFVIILPNTTANNAQTMVDRLQTFLSQHPLNIKGISIQVSFSAGVATIEETTVTDAESLLKRADEILYQAKQLKK